VLSSQFSFLFYSQLGFGFHEGSNTIDHVLDEVLLGSAESSEVGDVENAIVGLSVLSVDTSDLNVVLSGDFVESLFVGSKLGELDVDGGTHGGTEVGWAGGDVAEMVVVGELEVLLDLGGGSLESGEDGLDVSSWLHGNDSELVLFVDPNEEGLGVVMEDTSSGWPVSVQVGCSKESVSLLEEEVIVNELLLILSSHGLEWVEFTFEITIEVLASLHDLVHDLESLLLGDTWTEWEFGEVSSNSDSSRVDHSRLLSSEFVVLQLLGIHVGHVLVILLVLVIVLNDLVEELLKLGVGLVGTGVNTDARVLVGNSGENASLEADTGVARLVLVLLPNLLGEALLELRLALWGEESVEVGEAFGGRVLSDGFHL